MRQIAVAAVALLLLGACGGDAAGSEVFCDATRTVVDLGSVEELPPEVDTMVEEAPDEIADAAETVRAAFRDAFDNQDPSAIQTEEFQDAAKELREYAVENCEGLTDETD
ncbi:MAG: hypothetical protein M3271_07410 [Actinomycetota bacterium]|nr:hypothetical protein [Actinomycetota bacterium]